MKITKGRVFQRFPRDWITVCAPGNGQNEAGKEIRSDLTVSGS